jgi:hypothetical protein
MSSRIRRLAVVIPLAGALLGVPVAWTATSGALADTWTGSPRTVIASGVTWGAQPGGVTWGAQPDDTWG